MRELALFAGAGGGILGGVLLGWRCVGAVEIDPYCREVLLRRQEDGSLPPFPIWDDIRTFDGRPWRGLVDVVTAGFPCQPWSVAGRRAGERDDRNLWPDTCRVLREVGPPFALLENVPGLCAHDYFGRILGDLAEAGYDAEWDVISAAEVGAPHIRKRLWILAYASGEHLRLERRRLGGPSGASATKPRDHGSDGDVADAEEHRRGAWGQGDTDKSATWWEPDRGRIDGDVENTTNERLEGGRDREQGLEEKANGLFPTGPSQSGRGPPQGLQQAARAVPSCGDSKWWRVDPATWGPESESFVGRVADGVAHRVDRLRALGNGQVPRVAVEAWMRLMDRREAGKE